MGKTYQVYPLALSKPFKEAPAAMYYKAYKGDPVEMIYGCFCLKCNETDDLVMVDTGLASQEDMEKYNYPFRRMKDAPTLKGVMDEAGLDPLKVKTIIFTHLHQDHCFNLELFPNAKMYVQKIELQHAATPTPIESKSYQKYDCPGLPAWARAFGRITTVEGDVDIEDGISVMFTPGHTPGSQSVIVDAKDGQFLLCGDMYYTQEQFDNVRMNGNFTDLEGWYRSDKKIKKYLKEHKAEILRVHDPRTYDVKVYG